MNRRILKKLCKKAKPLLIERGMAPADFFRSEELEPCWSSRRIPKQELILWPPEGKPNPHGYFQPLKGTIGWGATSGYYEPEWEDRPAWDLLVNLYAEAHTYWHEHGFNYSGNRPLPARVLGWARGVIKA